MLDDSEEEANNFADDSINHCEKKLMKKCV